MPVNLGAATFDAIDQSGHVYSTASWIPFKADELLTQDIRLDSIFQPSARELSPEDSVYLSFYYQPQGRGNQPEPFDSLVLEFGHYDGDSILRSLCLIFL